MYSTRFGYTNVSGNGISATGSVLINSGRTHLHTININSVAPSNVGTFTVYDGTSAAGVALTSPISGSVNNLPACLIYDTFLTYGLYIGCTSFNGNLTVTSKPIN
jgi:hypothetical protein